MFFAAKRGRNKEERLSIMYGVKKIENPFDCIASLLLLKIIVDSKKNFSTENRLIFFIQHLELFALGIIFIHFNVLARHKILKSVCV